MALDTFLGRCGRTLTCGVLLMLLLACGGGSGDESEGQSNTDSSVGSDSQDSSSDGAGSGDGGTGTSDDTDSGGTGDSGSASSVSFNLIANTRSATTALVQWQAPDYSVSEYRLYRNGEWVATTTDTRIIDTQLSAGGEYVYQITAVDGEGSESALSNQDKIKTLVNDTNDGTRNGAIATETNITLRETCDARGIDDVTSENLDTCLNAAVSAFALREHLEDLRAFTARIRREEEAAKVELGMRLFYSKALSQNKDTACVSCHHPNLGCGGDGLSLPIGVNAENPALLGPGRSNGEDLPIVPRHSQQTCNSALWGFALFWDDRVKFSDDEVFDSDIRTEERSVTNTVNASEGKSLLMAQAHFPVTAAAEMGDPTQAGFESAEAYRQHLADNLDARWQPYFTAAFGDSAMSFERIAIALAAYEKTQLFIDTPFYDYLDGDLSALSEEEKRGAIFFYTNAGCSNCHDGAFFTPEKTRPPAYPQIGIGNDENGYDIETYRVPSLLNVELTAPYGHAGQFETLERVIMHYSDTPASIESYFADNETCQLSQFAHLGEDCEAVIAPNGLANSQAVFAANGSTAPAPNFSEQEVAYLVAFLEALTDESARPGSPEIQTLIPPRDGGPDGLQLDAVDAHGNAL